MLGQFVKLRAATASEVRMSKRTGNIITLADILDEVDPDVARHDVPAAGHRHRADVRPRRRDRAVDGEPRLLRAVRARAHRVDRPQGRRARASCASRSPTVDLAPLVHERETRAAARARAATPTWSHEAAEARAPQKVTTWVRDFAGAFHGFYRDCRVLTDDAELTQARLWLDRGVPDRARRTRSACSACTRPTRWRASTTTTSDEAESTR